MNFLKQYRYPLSITFSLIAIFFIFQNATCSPPSAGPSRQTTSNLDYGAGQLSINASKASIALNETAQLQVQGGTPPYTFFVLSGGGSVDTNGVYTAPSNPTTAQVEVVDSPKSSVGVINLTVSQSTGAKYSSLLWQTTGSGQITFTVTPSGNEFAISVSSHESQAIQQTFSLTSSNNNDVYQFVKALFQGSLSVTSDGSPGSSGNWSTITLNMSSGADQFTSPLLNGSSDSFDSLYQFVVSNLD